MIAGGYPLTAYYSHYWFGDYWILDSNVFGQSEETEGISDDVGVSLSWQGLEVPAGGSKSVSFIFRSGQYLIGQPGLRADDFPAQVPVGGSFWVTFTIDEERPGSILKIFLVVDNDVSGITLVAVDWSPSAPIEAEVGLDAYSLTPAMHSLLFYAVNDIGFVSNPFLPPIVVIPAAPNTPAMSPNLSQSPRLSQTPASFSSSTPFALEYPFVFY
jgi:hypothetical protein